jgi:hypothetical protein
MMNWKKFGRKLMWPNHGINLAFVWRAEENHTNLQPE